MPQGQLEGGLQHLRVVSAVFCGSASFPPTMISCRQILTSQAETLTQLESMLAWVRFPRNRPCEETVQVIPKCSQENRDG